MPAFFLSEYFYFYFYPILPCTALPNCNPTSLHLLPQSRPTTTTSPTALTPHSAESIHSCPSLPVFQPPSTAAATATCHLHPRQHWACNHHHHPPLHTDPTTTLTRMLMHQRTIQHPPSQAAPTTSQPHCHMRRPAMHTTTSTTTRTICTIWLLLIRLLQLVVSRCRRRRRRCRFMMRSKRICRMRFMSHRVKPIHKPDFQNNNNFKGIIQWQGINIIMHSYHHRQ
ncbi:hypothetical protein BJ741DRAFT_594442 [Chytriomyces cf. hyalinus JEL632]|nr:hypothetical protein BJ741DRAFT_594442 [Chytriomyces cf. hyalinus JEL632]